MVGVWSQLVEIETSRHVVLIGEWKGRLGGERGMTRQDQLGSITVDYWCRHLEMCGSIIVGVTAAAGLKGEGFVDGPSSLFNVEMMKTQGVCHCTFLFRIRNKGFAQLARIDLSPQGWLFSLLGGLSHVRTRACRLLSGIQNEGLGRLVWSDPSLLGWLWRV